MSSVITESGEECECAGVSTTEETQCNQLSCSTRSSGSRNYMSQEGRWNNKLIRSADKGAHWTTMMGSMSWYILVNLGLLHEARCPCSYLPGRKIGGQLGVSLHPMEEVQEDELAILGMYQLAGTKRIGTQ